MIDWRILFCLALLGLLLAGYMARFGHAHWLVDLSCICAALFVRYPELALLACAILIAVRQSNWIAGALAESLPDWLGRVLLPGAYNMSTPAVEEVPDVDSPEPAISGLTLPLENVEIPQPVAEKAYESFYLGETTALARLVAAGKIGLTEAVQIGGAAKSGKKYQQRSADVRAAVTGLTERFPQQTEEQRQQRAALKM